MLQMSDFYEVAPKVVFKCSICNTPIQDGEDYYDVAGDEVCEHCIEHSRRTAEAPDYIEEDIDE